MSLITNYEGLGAARAASANQTKILDAANEIIYLKERINNLEKRFDNLCDSYEYTIRNLYNLAGNR